MKKCDKCDFKVTSFKNDKNLKRSIEDKILKQHIMVVHENFPLDPRIKDKVLK